jgi:hypothetical protein
MKKKAPKIGASGLTYYLNLRLTFQLTALALLKYSVLTPSLELTIFFVILAFIGY